VADGEVSAWRTAAVALASSPNQAVENPVQPLRGLRHFAFRYHDQTDIETFCL